MLLSSQDCKLIVTECLGGLGGRCCVVPPATTGAVALLPAFLLPHFQIKANAVFSLQELWLLNAAVCSQIVIQKQNQKAVPQNQTDWKILLTANETALWKKIHLLWWYTGKFKWTGLDQKGSLGAADERQAEIGAQYSIWPQPDSHLSLF